MSGDHECDDRCVCPVHGTPLLYAPSKDDHACQDVDCVHGHGGVTPGEWSEVDRIAREVLAESPRFRQEYEGRWTP
jgi:hypothetical protein